MSARLSRRRLLAGGLGGAAVVVGAAGAGAVWARETDEPADALSEALPFYGAHQAGILTPQQRHLHFASFDVDAAHRRELQDLLRMWTTAAARLTQGASTQAPANAYAPPADTGEADGLGPARLTLTFGFGPGLFDSRYGLTRRRPAALAALPPFPGDQLEPGRSGGDLCVQACADDSQVAFHAVRNLTRVARGAASLRWLQEGFLTKTDEAPHTPRNLMGFRDGTANLDPTDDARMQSNVWADAADGQRWMDGGTYLVARRVRIRVEQWDRTAIGEQERFVGRHKESGAPIGGTEEQDPVRLRKLDVDSHIRLANPRAGSASERERILRRGYNFSDGLDGIGEIDAGLFFLAFQRDPRRQFVSIQSRLSASDLLHEYLFHTGSALFAIPPGVRSGGYVGEGLFA